MASFAQYQDAAGAMSDPHSRSGLEAIEAHLRKLVDLAGSTGKIAGKAATFAAQPTGTGFAKEAISQMKDFAGVVQNAVAPFKELSEWATHFTEAIDPALVAELNRAFRDLQAVVGIALRPITDTTRELVRYLGGTLMPLMRRLEPIIAELSGKIGERFKKSISDLSDALESLPWEDIKDVLVGVMDIFEDVGHALSAVGSVVWEAIKELVAGLTGGAGLGSIKDLMGQVRSTVQEALRSLLVFAASLMKMAGWASGVEALVKGLQKAAKPPKQAEDDRGTAVTGAQTKALADLGKSIYESAFMASAYGGDKKDPAAEAAKWLESIAGDIKGLPDGKTIEGQLKALVADLEARFTTYLTTKLDQVTDKVGRTADNLWEEANAYFDTQVQSIINSLPGKEALSGARSFVRGAAQTASHLIDPLGITR